MFGRIVVCLPLTLLLPTGAQAQQRTKIPQVGLLTGISAEGMSTRAEAFRQGLRELGYIYGKNVLVEYRYADGKTDRLNQPDISGKQLELLKEIVPRLSRLAVIGDATVQTRPN